MTADVTHTEGSAIPDHVQRVRAIVSDCLHRWAEGQPLDLTVLIDAHPELAPVLAEELAKLRLVLDAAGQSVSGLLQKNSDLLSDTLPGRLRGIPVRCPHCRHSFELLSDAELSGITCEACGQTFDLVDEALATDEAPPLNRVGHFELISRLGTGSFGAVWKARDLELDRTVAVKIPRSDRCDAGEQEKFLREARAAAQLRHPSIVAIYEVGREEETPYIVCDLVRGVTLAQWLDVHRPTSREAAELCIKIARALQHAHEAGVIHRDLKPSNIMLDADDEPHVMDFGIAKWEAGGATIALEGEPLGTAAYMSPEQADGKGHYADARSDVYSLGVVLFELLTGEVPFRGSRQMILHQVIHDEPPSPRKLNAAVTRDLETICLKCLQKRPDARIGSAAEVAEELTRYLEGRPIRSRPIGAVQRTLRAARRRPAVAAVIALVALIAVAGLIVTGLLYQRLHAAMLSEAELLTLSRQEGYTIGVLDVLHEAQRLPAFDQQWDRQQELVVAALGDFVGRRSIVIAGEPAFEQRIICLKFDHDAARIAVGLGFGGLAVFDARSGKRIGSLHGYSKDAHIRAIRFLGAADDADGSGLLFVDSDGTVVTAKWTGSGYEPGQVLGQLGMTGIWSARFSQDGRRLVAHTNEYAAIWATDSWKRLATFEVPPEPSTTLTNLAGFIIGRLAAVSGMGTSACLSASSLEVDRPETRIASVAISSDGTYVVAGYRQPALDCGFFIWDAASGELLDHKKGRGGTYTSGVAFAPGGNLLALASERLVKYELPPPLRQHDVHSGDEIVALAYHPLAAYEAIYYVGNKLTIRNWVVNRELGSVNIADTDGREVLLFSENGRCLALSTGQTIHIWNMEVPERRIWQGHVDAGGVSDIAFSPDGELIVTGGKDQMVRIWDAATGRQQRPPLAFGGKVQCVTFSPDGRLLAIGTWGTSDENLTIWRTADWNKVKTVEHTVGDRIFGLDFGKHGRDGESYRLAACGTGMCLWDVRLDEDTQGQSQVDVVPRGRVEPSEVGGDGRFLQFSPNGEFVVWAEFDLVRVADCRRESLPSYELTRLVADGYQGLAFAEEDEASSLVVIGRAGKPEVWSITGSSTQPDKVIDHADSRLLRAHLALSPDGRFLAALVDTRSVGIWDLYTEKRLFVLRPESSDVWSLTWSGDRRLAVGTASGELSVWDMNAIANELRKLNLAPVGLADHDD